MSTTTTTTAATYSASTTFAQNGMRSPSDELVCVFGGIGSAGRDCLIVKRGECRTLENVDIEVRYAFPSQTVYRDIQYWRPIKPFPLGSLDELDTISLCEEYVRKHTVRCSPKDMVEDYIGESGSRIDLILTSFYEPPPEVTAVDFADDNNYRDILKCILPCIVDILPRDSVVVQAIRLCGIIRTIASLNPVSDEQIEYLEKCLPKYEAICLCLSLDLDKNYNYPKHHTLLHLTEDLRAKGSTIRKSRSLKIDENQEAIAQIRTAVDIHDKLMEESVQEQNITDGDECPTPITSKDHWSLDSPLSSILANKYELEHAERKGF
ncbi:hypothetical protein M422DRAFT_248461 [Sphaerobolus stellatus SS14]|uniref:Uncharacterized protein n=1 Tax=Sphaerobolus stellatus (strain SS14) TaxID=990650 RepID=A0A0C9W4N6_SPHS4|nr:hypothetical protein M422DRAFT_248461 [Sphaerobolus stellatus SS14]